MKTVNLKYILLTLIVVAGIALVFFSWARPGVTEGEGNKDLKTTENMLGTQVGSEDGVEVSVTPSKLSDDSWTFEVVLSTHSVELSDDLAKSSTLVDKNGNSYKAIAWEGDPPGGHHREGVLKFNSTYPMQESIELRIKLGDKERSFKWKLPQ